MPGPPHVVHVPHRIGAVPRSHQALGGRRHPLSGVKRVAAEGELFAAAAGAVIGYRYDSSLVDSNLTPVKYGRGMALADVLPNAPKTSDDALALFDASSAVEPEF